LLQVKRVVKKAYDAIIEKKSEQPENTMQKWQNDIPINDEMWTYFFTIAIKCALDIPTRSFQFLLLHWRLPTNKFVHRIGLIDSPNCTFCKENTESLLHLFYECERVKSFWIHVESFINIIYGFDLSLTKFSIYFGYNIFDPDPLIILFYWVKNIYTEKDVLGHIQFSMNLREWFILCFKLRITLLFQRTNCVVMIKNGEFMKGGTIVIIKYHCCCYNIICTQI